METLIKLIEEAIENECNLIQSYEKDVERHILKRDQLQNEFAELTEKLGLNTLKEVA